MVVLKTIVFQNDRFQNDRFYKTPRFIIDRLRLPLVNDEPSSTIVNDERSIID